MNKERHLENVINFIYLKGQFWTKPDRFPSLFNTCKRNLSDY